MWCAAENHNCMRHICAKGLLDSKIIDKISIFHEIASNFTFTKVVVFKV